MGDGGEWAARCWLYIPYGVFGLAMNPIRVSHRPKHAWTVYETTQYYWSQFQTYVVHVVPSMGPVVSSMGPVVSVMNLHVQQNVL